MPEITCPCGVQFFAYPSRIAKGIGKYCSQACYHRLTVRLSGEAAPLWKGDAASYGALHVWVRRWKGRPLQCLFCGTTDGYLEWANISQEYHRDVSDWMPLCVKCHRRYDAANRSACSNGHERTVESTMTRNDGRRECRICANERHRERRALGKAG